MKTLNIYDELKSNSYPGRGIVIGKSADGKSAVTAYFIMGAVQTAATVFLWKKERASVPRRLILQN